jgi:hypothetical protein
VDDLKACYMMPCLSTVRRHMKQGNGAAGGSYGETAVQLYVLFVAGHTQIVTGACLGPYTDCDWGLSGAIHR